MEIITTECQCDLCLSIRKIQEEETITQDRLKEVLDYNPDTGIFRWIETIGGRAVIGDKAGSRKGKGYVVIRIYNKDYYAHRLAILYTDGYMPENEVDHIDRVRWHNWRSNLREASRQCQLRNCGMNRNNTSGVKGIYWDKNARKWRAKIMVGGKHKNLGLYNSLLGAAYARFAAEQCLGFQDCDINSSARKYINAAVSENLR